MERPLPVFHLVNANGLYDQIAQLVLMSFPSPTKVPFSPCRHRDKLLQKHAESRMKRTIIGPGRYLVPQLYRQKPHLPRYAPDLRRIIWTLNLQVPKTIA